MWRADTHSHSHTLKISLNPRRAFKHIPLSLTHTHTGTHSLTLSHSRRSPAKESNTSPGDVKSPGIESSLGENPMGGKRIATGGGGGAEAVVVSFCKMPHHSAHEVGPDLQGQGLGDGRVPQVGQTILQRARVQPKNVWCPGFSSGRGILHKKALSSGFR